MAQEEITVRLATEKDTDTINKAFNDLFLRSEPVNVYMRKYKSPLEHGQNLPNEGLTLVAEVRDPVTSDRKFAGFLMCSVCRADNPVTAENFVLRTDYRVGYEIFKMLNELDRRFNIFDLYNVQEAMDMLVLCVADEFRGRSIGRRLCEAGLNLAATKGYPIVFMDCTSHFSAAAALRIGMECIGEIGYEEYQHENTGEHLFAVTGPHTHLRRFVKVVNRKV